MREDRREGEGGSGEGRGEREREQASARLRACMRVGGRVKGTHAYIDIWGIWLKAIQHFIVCFYDFSVSLM